MSVLTSASLWTLLSLWVLVSASEVHNITADPGQTVTLKCNATNTNVIVVEWTRPDLEPDSVFMYRDERPDPENQYPSFQNRVELVDRQMKDGNVSLILKNVTREDRGRYECRVVQRGTNRRKRSDLDSELIISIINLDVRSSGNTQGHREEGGDKEGDSRGHGVAAGLSVVAVVALVVALGTFMSKRHMKKNPHLPPCAKEARDQQLL